MRHGPRFTLIAVALCLCAVLQAQVVIKPEPVFNGLSPNGLRFRVRSAQSRDAIQIKSEPIRAGRSLLGFRITLKNRTHQDIEIFAPELGTTLTITVGNPKRDTSLQPRPVSRNVAMVSIPSSSERHFDFMMDALSRRYPEIHTGDKVKVAFGYDDRYVNSDSNAGGQLGSRKLGTYTVRWMGNSEYQMR